ncbi:DUF2868 domain-containing protein [Variovorax sp. LT1R16]|uniref:DUF2868 domain-containing protein n=1 Tax=Variovorax sp. LT1R16 TaxID=3443728 RepID=UPI003F48AA85
MNIASRPPATTPPPNALITEAVQLIEEAGPLDDAAAMREAFARRSDTPGRIAQRAQLLGQRLGLPHELARARLWAPWVGLGLVLVIVLAGLAMAGSVVGGPERRINIMAALISLLGVHLLTLLAWLVGLLLPLRAPRLSFGWLWMTLTARVAGGRKGQAPVLLRAATRLLSRARLLPWALGLVSHGIWTLSFVVVLGALLFALAFHRYTLNWETTILDPQFFLQAVQALGRLPAWFGFATPDAGVVLAPGGMADAVGQRSWALWLTGCIVVYGLLPRLLLLLWSAAMWQWRRRGLQPALDAPYYRRLAARFDALAPPAIVDADPGALHPQAPLRPLDTGDALIAVGFELPPDIAWPPAGLPAEAQWLRIDGGAEARRTLLDTAARLRPRALLLACRAAASPDRGTERLLRELLAHCGECRLWLLPDDGSAMVSEAGIRRWRDWLRDTGLERIAAHERLTDALAGW